ncbi:cytochrome b/b6 domain-containing protein [Lichenicola sp.]|uniref:cytochrome b/b6 domain-containing protein n=1 Tax=Lichenicola sp. TaxID=2804529 RepID=UPI003B0071D0
MTIETTMQPSGPKLMVVHPLVVRLTHWVNAVAIVMMVMSGWQIYNASPLIPFRFPAWATLGGWLGGGIAWHLAAMWLLVANGLLYFGYGLIARHFRRSFLPLTPRAIGHDLGQALTFRLKHKLGTYNAVQRLLYVGVLALGVVVVVSGLGIWKPVQLQLVDAALGGYGTLRWIHFFAMTGIVLFVVVHLALVAVVPSTLPAMITGRARIAASPVELDR